MPEDRWFVGCMLPDFSCYELAYEAGMPEDQLFGFRGGAGCFLSPVSAYGRRQRCLRP